jgi:hypothetical protein
MITFFLNNIINTFILGRLNPLLAIRGSDFSFGKTRRLNPLLAMRGSDFFSEKTRRII